MNIPDCEEVQSTDIGVREGHWGAVNGILEHDSEIRLEGINI